MCQELILSWQDVKTHQWFPVGRFAKEGNGYSFVYTHGAEQAKENGFIGLKATKNFNAPYYSHDIFPLLHNRILNKSRPERAEFLKWLDVDINSDNADFEELARTNGVKVTDNLRVFPVPIKTNNRYILSFFAQGIRHLSPASEARIKQLKQGEKLFFCADLENRQDKDAHLFRTEDPVEMVGYCPKYFAKDFKKLFRASEPSFTIKVKQVNQEAPEQLRLLCEITCDWPQEFLPFDEEKFKSCTINEER